MPQDRRQKAHEAFEAKAKADLAAAIKAESADAVDKVFNLVLASRLELATEADSLDGQLESAKKLIGGKGLKVLPEHVQKMVDQKVAAGLPYDDAVDVSLRQHKLNEERAAEAKSAKK